MGRRRGGIEGGLRCRLGRKKGGGERKGSDKRNHG